jgi:hypothetical protein
MKRIEMISVSVLVAGVLVMGVLTSHGSAADAPAVTKTESKPSVIVGGFSIARAREGDKYNRSMAFGIQSGTNVSLYVSMPGKTIIELDKEASKLTKFTDDKGTVLAKPGSGKSYESWLGTRPPIGNDGHSCAPSVRSKKLPAAGSSALILDARLAFICGDQPETAQWDVSLTKGTPVKLGTVAAKISKIEEPTYGKMKLNVTFTSSQSFRTIHKLVFLDSAGKEIKSRGTGNGSSTFGSKKTYTRTYGLAKKVDKVTIKIDYWGKIETVTVPVKVNVQMGL